MDERSASKGPSENAGADDPVVQIQRAIEIKSQGDRLLEDSRSLTEHSKALLDSLDEPNS